MIIYIPAPLSGSSGWWKLNHGLCSSPLLNLHVAVSSFPKDCYLPWTLLACFCNHMTCIIMEPACTCITAIRSCHTKSGAQPETISSWACCLDYITYTLNLMGLCTRRGRPYLLHFAWRLHASCAIYPESSTSFCCPCHELLAYLLLIMRPSRAYNLST